MKQERLKVLTMLENGTITVDDATRLLEAIGASNRISECGVMFEEQASKVAQTLDSVSKDVGNKMGAVYKSVEPKVKLAAKVVAEKIAAVADDVSKSLNETAKNLQTEETCCCEDDDCCCCCADDTCATNDAPASNDCDCSEKQ